MKKWFFPIVVAGVGAAILQFSCTYEKISTPVCFESDVLPIFQSSCLQSTCHNANDRAGGYDLSDYAGILHGVKAGNYSGSRIYTEIKGSNPSMPKSPFAALTTDQVTLIARWIESGAENTTNCSTSTCDTTAVPTFAATVQPLLQKYCTNCHSGSSPQGDVDLSTWAKTKVYADAGSLVGTILRDGNYSEMPKNGNKLPDCEIAQIAKWVSLGALNN